MTEEQYLIRRILDDANVEHGGLTLPQRVQLLADRERGHISCNVALSIRLQQAEKGLAKLREEAKE